MTKNKIKEILIRSKKNVLNNFSGNQQSILKGTGLDFKEIEEYNPGDDVRKINWKATAKQNGKPFINIYEEEKQLDVYVLFMINGNIEYKQKKEIMSEIMSVISFSAIKNNDYISNIFISNKEEKHFYKTKNKGMINKSLNYIFSLPQNHILGKNIDNVYLINYIKQKIKRKSIIFIISDFYEEINFEGLGFKHEIYSIIVRDKTEEEPMFNDEIEIFDPITLETEKINFNESLLKKYKKEIEEKNKKLFQSFKKQKIKYIKIQNIQEIYIKLKQLLRY
jgi:hypothetical protein